MIANTSTAEADRTADTASEHSVALRGTDPPTTLPHFGLARAGYDRDEVEAYLGVLHARLADAQDAERAARRRIETLTEQQSTLSPDSTAAPDPTTGGPPQAAPPAAGLGERMENLLRAAEAEAHDIRAEAQAAAQDELEAAHRDAQARREQLDSDLTARAARIEQLAQDAAEHAAARAEQLDNALAAAHAAAAETLRQAEAEAAEIRRAATDDAHRHHQDTEAELVSRRREAKAELEHIHHLHHRARHQLAGLLDTLTPEFTSGDTEEVAE